MKKGYDEGHVDGASKAKNVATAKLQEAFKIKESKIDGTTPNERFESALRLAVAKLSKCKKRAKSAKDFQS